MIGVIIDIVMWVYNYKWKIDLIVWLLIDMDFYKLLMCQLVFCNWFDINVIFSLINCLFKIWLVELIDESELCEQLDYVCGLLLMWGESIWLCGNIFYGKCQMFCLDFMEFLENLCLFVYYLEKCDGQYELIFEGKWFEVMLWEIFVFVVIMELCLCVVLKDMGWFELQVLYVCGMIWLWEKVEVLCELGLNLWIVDFGMWWWYSFLWQDWCVQVMIEGLGDKVFVGILNCLIVMCCDIEVIGINVYELLMVYVVFVEIDVELCEVFYCVLVDWYEEYDGNLCMILFDIYGMKQFLVKVLDWLVGWIGICIDSGDFVEGVEVVIEWW